MKKLIHNGPTQPEAFVTKRRQRVKQFKSNDSYENIVYLNNGDEFEIELFNPTSTKVLAEIELNGVSLKNGMVLRPGERIFLERYFDEPKKFLFETYEVDENDSNVQQAIKNNGKVVVKFYGEYIPSNYYFTNYSPPINPQPWTPWGDDFKTITTTGTSYDQPIFGYSSQANSITYDGVKSFHVKNSIETGRVEKGSISKQSFLNDYTSFNNWWSWVSMWKILPMSRKSFQQEDLKIYCTNCGMKRRRSSFLFCPNCGQKY